MSVQKVRRVRAGSSFGRTISPRVRVTALVAASVALSAGVAVGMPSSSGANGVLHACVNKKTKIVRLVGALDAILPVVPFRRQQLGDLVHRPRRAAAVGSRCVKHVLADLELVVAQGTLHVPNGRASPAAGRAAHTFLVGFMMNHST